MTDEIKLLKQTEQANRAARLLNDEMLVAAFDALESQYLQAWRYTNVGDEFKRERLWQAIHIVAKVKEHLSTIINGGKLAQAELDSVTYLKTN